MQYELLQLPRTSSCSHHIIVPSSVYATSSSPDKNPTTTRKPTFRVSTFLQSLLAALWPVSTHRWLTTNIIPSTPPISLPRSRKVIGTLFGHRKGHVSFAVQEDPRSVPVFLVRISVSTANLVREMSSGWVRISLESDKVSGAAKKLGQGVKLFKEPAWSTYCNGRKYAPAVSRTCTVSDWHVLSTVSSVGAGAGVIPVVGDGQREKESEGELMYMRARFERVVGNRDAEAFHMMSPEKNAGPDLSIFLLRV